MQTWEGGDIEKGVLHEFLQQYRKRRGERILGVTKCIGSNYLVGLDQTSAVGSPALLLFSYSEI
jgi:hypothetical protein